MLTFCQRLFFLSVILLSSGCIGETILPTPVPTAVLRSTTGPSPQATSQTSMVSTPTLKPDPTVPPTPTPTIFSISAVAAVPHALVAAAQEIAATNPQFRWVDDPATADLHLAINDGQPLTTWHYVFAAPFATIPDDTSLEAWTVGWQTGQNNLGATFITPETAAAWATVWQDGIPKIRVVPAEELSAALWAERPSLTLLPFHHLTPDLKVLTVNGRSPLAPNFDPTNYPLQLTFGLVARETAEIETAVSQFQQLWPEPVSNHDPAKLTRLAMTGVTALVRATAYQMEINGILYPGTDVKPILQTADFAHVSNEAAFSPNCPYPNPIGGTTFCSRESYFALLQEIGINIVELTGNHVNDWGRENFVHSLDLYTQAGMETFGGGRNAAEANEPLLLNHNGNKIALTGCNPSGPNYAWATAELAGSRFCDEGFKAQIQQLRSDDYQVIVTQQYAEYYHYAATVQQQADFKAFIDAGATAVSGSQAHHAQGFDLYNGGFIHYGLGNLFFDQMDQLGTRQSFVDVYTFYNGRLLNVTLWTGLIENYAYPRLMTAAEREQALRAVFQASGW
ncbi:MAG: CapA family protein [Chloroflexota bacterium]